MLELIPPHIERVLSRAALYLNLPSQSSLTPREVLHWIAQGKRDSEIAVILKISARTVEQHVRVCLRKLGVETRSAAAATIWRARYSSAATIE
jgi:DNA-binding CsgD family transcriptional regulator